MKPQRMELVGLEVSDLEAAMQEFGSILGTEFIRIDFDESSKIEYLPTDGDARALAATMSMAMDKTGYLELIQSDPPTTHERVRNIHFKVDDIEEAIAEMRSKGYRLVANLRIGRMREAVFGARELRGLRMCMVQYEGPSMVEAMLDE